MNILLKNSWLFPLFFLVINIHTKCKWALLLSTFSRKVRRLGVSNLKPITCTWYQTWPVNLSSTSYHCKKHWETILPCFRPTRPWSQPSHRKKNRSLWWNLPLLWPKFPRRRNNKAPFLRKTVLKIRGVAKKATKKRRARTRRIMT